MCSPYPWARTTTRSGAGRSQIATLRSPVLPLIVMRSAMSALLVGQQLARVHDPHRIQAPLGRPDDLDPQLAHLVGHPRDVVAADRVVVGDRAARGDDRVARRPLRRPPLLDLGAVLAT